MILFAMHMYFVYQEMYRWGASQEGVIVDFFGGGYLHAIFLPIGWIFIGLGYRQFSLHTKREKTKTDQKDLSYWTNKSGTFLLALAIISMIFNLALTGLILIFFLSLISIIFQFIIGVRLRMWTAPKIEIPAEIMIPGRI